MEKTPMFTKGKVFQNPDDLASGYILTTDVFLGDHVEAAQFEPFGDVPTPKTGEVIPIWLKEAAKIR